MADVQVVITQPGHAERVYTIAEGATRFGRADDNEIVLPDVGVSRRHAQIVLSRGGEVTIEDLGSGNGTYYNGFRVKSQPLRDGDEVVIDPFVLRFRVPGMGASPVVEAAPAGARLDVVVGTGLAGNVYPIGTRGLTLGRAEDRDVVVPDPASSRHHCHIYLQDGEYILHDNGSANGVFVNSVRIRECTLTDGDLVRIGNTEMRFVRGAQTHDTTTQVVPPDVWDARAGEAAPAGSGGYGQVSTGPSAPAPQRGSMMLYVLTGAASLAFFAVAVVLVGVALAVVLLKPSDGVIHLPTRAPAWHLQLPGGLASVNSSELFSEGVSQMGRGERREALQNFYRVLESDRGNAAAETFAFAAGEMLLLDALEARLDKEVRNQRVREEARDVLLRQAERSGAPGKRAEDKLIESYRDDPVVMKALGLSPSAKAEAVRTLNENGATALASKRYAAAAKAYREVLSTSRDPLARKEAVAGVRTAERELAKLVTVPWQQAVMAEALGDVPGARRAFGDVVRADGNNVSARVHLGHLEGK